MARLWLACAVAAGLLLGLVQQWRGAHFMSHTVWSAAVCWAVAALVDAMWPRSLRAERV
jgi:membrane-associated PAP2 superfamily phosphatase